MRGLVNIYYKHLSEVEAEIVIFLETCLETISAKHIADPKMLIDIIAINKINNSLHGSNRIKFLCDRIEEAIFNLSVIEGEITITEIEETQIAQPKTRYSKLVEQPFNMDFKS